MKQPLQDGKQIICKSESCFNSERKLKECVQSGTCHTTDGIRAFCSLVSRYDPFHLALLSFQTSLKKKHSHICRRARPRPRPSTPTLCWNALPQSCQLPSGALLLRLTLGLRSSSGCYADNRQFDYLLVPTPANYSCALMLPLRSDRAAPRLRDRRNGTSFNAFFCSFFI